MNELNFIIRNSHEGDANLILSSWRKSFKSLNPEYNYCVPHRIFNPWFKEKQINILQNGARALVAVNPKDLNQIFGYILYQPQKPFICHYLYVKNIYRKLGIGKALLKEAGHPENEAILVTATTRYVHKLKNYEIIYIPEQLQSAYTLKISGDTFNVKQ